MTGGIPDNVDLHWIARHLVEMRGEFGGLRDDVRTLRDDFGVMAAILRRVEELRQIYELYRDLRGRLRQSRTRPVEVADRARLEACV